MSSILVKKKIRAVGGGASSGCTFQVSGVNMREREREQHPIDTKLLSCQDARMPGCHLPGCKDARMPGYSRMGYTINIQFSDVSMIERERESNIPRS